MKLGDTGYKAYIGWDGNAGVVKGAVSGVYNRTNSDGDVKVIYELENPVDVITGLKFGWADYTGNAFSTQEEAQEDLKGLMKKALESATVEYNRVENKIIKLGGNVHGIDMNRVVG